MILYWLLALFVCCCLRLYAILPEGKKVIRRTRRRSETCSLAVFLGSGGHTSEVISLLSSLDFSRYTPRTYYIGEGDTLSMKKAIVLESLKVVDYASSSVQSLVPYTFVTLPRARRVHQPLITTPITALRSLAVSSHRERSGDVLRLMFSYFVGLTHPALIYVESFARVRTLSLSGKLLRPLVDRFIVQWPDLLRDGKKGDYRGWLV
ncbi:UDP-N-acetylglucosamine transferase subunit ALG14 [Sparassis crispa]|uniref:UDP-N-acetylglucosamine transferase subunit ALG14 n=1 Tax=Sparassis crispa TaxID=139825 RepID=A0A401GFU7_9APHY|nr:UDP-N-acetylglucosamine transferase subunit ALG14 [Sparassis crispa]GBE81001.1 UDP-N-acetylglucosamine transferase subunit ALG14 [Sparassis crispa]